MDLRPPFDERDGQIALELPGAHALFTLRSSGDLRSTQDAVAARLGVRLAGARQVHGDGVLTAGVDGLPAGAEADAIVSVTPGVAATVLAADCLPIVVASRGAVAAIHAGWRGLAAGVIARAVGVLRAQGRGVLQAAIGPGAGPCCYEVADDLHRRFRAQGQDFRRGGNLDLKAIARVQLMEAGIARIHDTGLCTICGDPALTYSYRRDGAQTGRHAAIVWLS